MNSKKDLLSLFSLFPKFPRLFPALAGFIVLGAISFLLFYASLRAPHQSSGESAASPASNGLFSENLFSRIFEAEKTPSGDNKEQHESGPFIPYNNAERGPLDFSLHVLGPGGGPTLFVVGGIQGDEPGAFSAASLLVTHYEITKGRLIVVPNLNFNSIVLRDRGPNGDMNRKFAALSPQDPEYNTVTKIKSLLLMPQVDAILNMHDGSGFYRPDWEDTMRNPKRWGQSVIIDQANIGCDTFGNMEQIAKNVLGRTNLQLLEPTHKYHLKNTHTALGDHEMEKTLTYFAITNGKPAFGVEASKDFSLPVRAYYHIQVLESFMTSLGIEFKRKFTPTPEGLALALSSDLEIYFPQNHLTVLLEDLNNEINYFPAQKGEEIKFSASSPLITIVPNPKNKNSYILYYGNRPVAHIRPEYMNFSNDLDGMVIEADGRKRNVAWGEVVSVNDNLLVKGTPGYRVNAIGAQVGKGASECECPIKRADFESRFALNKASSLFRVEVYKQHGNGRPDSFAGMFLVSYPMNTAKNSKPLLPGVEGKETLLGY